MTTDSAPSLDAVEQVPDLEWIWSKALEAYKARLTSALAILLAMISLTGYGLANKMAGVLVAAAAFPLLLIGVDLFIVAHYLVPFIYMALIRDVRLNEQESVTRLFLTYAYLDEKLVAIVSMEPGLLRQRAFRRRYLCRSLLMRVVFGFLGVVGEILLAAYVHLA